MHFMPLDLSDAELPTAAVYPRPSLEPGKFMKPAR